MARILLVASTTGYQTRAFEDAARRLGVDLVYVTDRCPVLDDPWRDGALAVQFEDRVASVTAVTKALEGKDVSGVLALGDRPAVLAAHLAEALGIEWHGVAGVEAASDKLTARGRWLAAGLPGPWFVSVDAVQTLATVADRLRFPCVVKPAALSASRGVMRADSFEECEQALDRVRRLLRAPDVSHLPARLRSQVIIEGFMPGHEYALEGIMDKGVLHVLAIFDKPDPLDGPCFEETIYVTPPSLSMRKTDPSRSVSRKSSPSTVRFFAV